jgi:hypothetical protein
MVMLTFFVGLRLFQVRIAEMVEKRIPAQAVALSAQRAQKLTDSRASDNYNYLFEEPILFYLLLHRSYRSRSHSSLATRARMAICCLKSSA